MSNADGTVGPLQGAVVLSATVNIFGTQVRASTRRLCAAALGMPYSPDPQTDPMLALPCPPALLAAWSTLGLQQMLVQRAARRLLPGGLLHRGQRVDHPLGGGRVGRCAVAQPRQAPPAVDLRRARAGEDLLHSNVAVVAPVQAQNSGKQAPLRNPHHNLDDHGCRLRDAIFAPGNSAVGGLAHADVAEGLHHRAVLHGVRVDRCCLLRIYMPALDRPLSLSLSVDAVWFVYTCRRLIDLSLIAGTARARSSSRWSSSSRPSRCDFNRRILISY